MGTVNLKVYIKRKEKVKIYEGENETQISGCKPCYGFSIVNDMMRGEREYKSKRKQQGQSGIDNLAA